MKRLTLIRSILLLLCLAGPPIRAQQPPNIILIMTDDQGYGDFGVTGNPVLRTPHLDAMAARSASISSFYVSPVCSPTRASLMTGRYNYRTRVVDTWVGRSMMDPAEVTVAELLREAGYGTGIFGKWHLGDTYPMRPQDQGFDEVLVHRGGGIGQPADPPGGEGAYTNPVLFHNGQRLETQGYCTDIYFDRALAWIEACERDRKPFFVYIAPNAPHGPFHDVPADRLAEYQQLDLDNSRFPQEVGHPLPADSNADVRARIFAMIANIDDNIGRLFERLDALALTENTLVIFLTDNGPNRRRYVAGFKGMKSGVHEGGIRSPFWAHWPARLTAGHTSNRSGAHIDVLPTILHAAGVPVPADLRLDGRSLLPLLTGDPAWPERNLVIQSHRGDTPVRYHHFMVRNDEWKLLHPSGFGRETFEGDPAFELYQISVDPLEESNVAAGHPAIVQQLRQAYDAWFDDVGGTRPDNFAPCRSIVGSPHEPTTVLTRQDWRTSHPQLWGKPAGNGVWHLTVENPGDFDVTVRLARPFSGGVVRLMVNDVPTEGTADPDAETIVFEAIRLEPGPLRIAALVNPGGQEEGPWQVELRRRPDPSPPPAADAAPNGSAGLREPDRPSPETG